MSSTSTANTWTKLLGSSSNEQTNGIAVSTDGFVYATGLTTGSFQGQVFTGGRSDIFLTKYSSDGAVIWSKIYGSLKNDASNSSGMYYSDRNDRSDAISVSTDGSIYIGGFTTGVLDGQSNNGGDTDGFLTKFSSAGEKIWTRMIGGSGGDYVTGIANGSDGSVYVTGNTSSNLDGLTRRGQFDSFVIKYDANGNKLWTRFIADANTYKVESFGNAISVGKDGNIAIVGSVNFTKGQFNGENFIGSFTDAFVTKYTPTGERLWSHLLGSSASGQQSTVVGYGVATAADGSIYITGNNTGSELDGQIGTGPFVTKYSADGVKAWTKLLGFSSAYPQGTSVAIGTDGGIFVGGSQANDGFVTKLSANGSILWNWKFSSTGNDQVNALNVASDGTLFVGGYSGGVLNGQTYNGSDSTYSAFFGGDAFIAKLKDTSSPPQSLAWSPSSSSENFYGSSGIDVLTVNGLKKDFSIYYSAGLITQTRGSSSAGFESIERFKFSDASLAFDEKGNAGIAAKVIGAVLGKNAVKNPTYVGIGLNYLDAGTSYSDLGLIALNAIGAKTNDAIVSTLWLNVVGVMASTADKAPFISMLENGMKPGDLVVLAAETSLLTVQLVGVFSNGLEYIPITS